MNRSSTTATVESIRESLRENPLFAGVPDDVLDQIAKLVSDSKSKKISQSLRAVQLFEGLSEEDVVRIQEVAETVTLAAGEVLFEEGKKGDTFYVVLRGRVELVKRGRDGSEQKLAVTREGEAFGEMALLNGSPRSATARASESAQLLELSREAFESLLGADSFATRMLRGISKALWATSVRLTSAQGKGADGRDVVRSLSRIMQKIILPAAVPQVEGFSVMAQTGSHEKADGESAWDWFRLGDDRTVFVALRAHGEGLPAGYSLALARTLLRELGRDHLDLAKLLTRVNDALVGAKVPGARQHVECALVAARDGELTWAAAGPVAAAVVRSGRSVVDLPADNAPLGAERGAIYRTFTVPMMPGDSFLTVARVAADGMARGKAIAAEMVESDAREVMKRIGAALPADDPITGSAFENTVLLLKCVDQAPAEGGLNISSIGLQPGSGIPLDA